MTTAKPLLLPPAILWCGKGGLPAESIFAAYLPGGSLDLSSIAATITEAAKGTLTQCLRRYPMGEQALIKVMKATPWQAKEERKVSITQFWSVSMSWVCVFLVSQRYKMRILITE